MNIDDFGKLFLFYLFHSWALYRSKSWLPFYQRNCCDLSQNLSEHFASFKYLHLSSRQYFRARKMQNLLWTCQELPRNPLPTWASYFTSWDTVTRREKRYEPNDSQKRCPFSERHFFLSKWIWDEYHTLHFQSTVFLLAWISPNHTVIKAERAL